MRVSAGRPGSWGALALLLVGLAVLGQGCGSSTEAGTRVEGSGEFPAFVYRSGDSVSAYRLASAMADGFAFIPCYCNCAVASGHRSLRDCYLREDGSLNEHASTCHVCIGEALDVGEARERGVSWWEIRTQIDLRYAKYGVATDTPFSP